MAEKSDKLLEKISDKIRSREESSSSDSDDEIRQFPDSSNMSKIYRLFGRKQADLFLWKDKKSSAAVLGGSTVIWSLFELMEYHFITLVCYALILMLAILFVSFNAATFLNKSPPHIPEIKIPEDPAINVVRSLIFEINRSLAVLKEIALGRDFKKFFSVIAGLWVLSIVGSFFSVLTLSFIAFVLLHTVPLVYAKHEDTIDSFGEKAMEEIKKQYAVVEAAVLSKIPRKDKSH